MIKGLADGVKRLAEALNSQDVDYMFVGGVANAYYGNIRPSTNLPKGVLYDIDVWYFATASNHAGLCKAIEQLDTEISKELQAMSFNPRKAFIKFDVDVYHFDFLPELKDFHHKDFIKCFLEKEVGEIDGVKVNVLSKKHLLLDKGKLARDKDLADIEALKKKSYKGFTR